MNKVKKCNLSNRNAVYGHGKRRINITGHDNNFGYYLKDWLGKIRMERNEAGALFQETELIRLDRQSETVVSPETISYGLIEAGKFLCSDIRTSYIDPALYVKN